MEFFNNINTIHLELFLRKVHRMLITIDMKSDLDYNAGAVISCNKIKVTFHINGNEHTVHFPKKQFQVNGINVIEKSPTITIGSFQIPLPTVKKYIKCLLLGTFISPLR